MKNYTKEITDYLDFVKENQKAIPPEVNLLIENIVIPTLERDDVFFDKETYKKCLSFCERWFYPLLPFQKFRYAFIFMYQKDNPDIVIFDDLFDLLARGNGKDGYLMPLALFLLTPAYGVKNYNIDIVATSEEQAINTFNVAYEMLDSNKKIMKNYFYWTKTMIINRTTKSRLRYNTSSAKTKDGKQTGMVIFNEYHAYENYKQINVFSSGLGKIKHARTWIITTDGEFRDGPLDKKIDIALAVLNGEDSFSGMFPLIFRLLDENLIHQPMKKYSETKNLKDVDFTFWERSNPSLRYFPILQDRLIKDYMKMIREPSYKSEFYTKRMNKPMRSEDIQTTSWDNILRTTYDDSIENWKQVKRFRAVPDTSGKRAIVGIDFASINDFATAGFLFKVGSEYVWKKKTWICRQSKHFESIVFPFDNIGTEGFEDFEIIDEPYIREELIVDWVVKNMEGYIIVKIIMDSHRFGVLRKSFESYGFTEETRNNKDGLIRRIRLPGSVYNMIIPIIEREFIKGSLNFCKSALMRWSTNNTGIGKIGGNLSFIKIEEKLRKNDPFMAFVHAFSGSDLLEQEVITVYY